MDSFFCVCFFVSKMSIVIFWFIFGCVFLDLLIFYFGIVGFVLCFWRFVYFVI